MQTPPPYRPDAYQSHVQGNAAVNAEVIASSAMKHVYWKMALALVVTGLTALFCAGSHAYMMFLAQNQWFMWVLFAVELIFVFCISGGLTKFSTTAVTLMFYAFAIVNGLWMAPVFLLYTATSIAKTFFITAGTFGAMTVYGLFTNRDLTRWGNFLIMALLGLIIASVVNFFFKSTQLGWIISIAGVLIFVGLTAWDTQYIRRLSMNASPEMVGKISTYGAMSLYLDFINLFLYLLRFFGNSRD